MTRSVQRHGHHLRRDLPRVVPLLDELPESTRSLPLDLIGGKRRVQGHVSHQVERGSEVLRERPGTDGRRVHGAPGIERGAKARHFVSNLQGAARLGAFIEHRGHKTGEARLLNGVGITACLDHEAGGNDRQTRSLVQDQRQAVRQRGRRGRREHQGARGTRLRHLEAPRLVGVDGLPSALGHLLTGSRLRLSGFDLWLAGDGMDHDTRTRVEVLPSERLDGLRRDGSISLNVFVEIVRRAEIVVVHVEPIGDTAEATQPIEPADNRGLDRISSLLDFCG